MEEWKDLIGPGVSLIIAFAGFIVTLRTNRGQYSKLTQEVNKIKGETEKLKAEVEKVKTEAEKNRAEVEKMQFESQIEKLKFESQILSLCQEQITKLQELGLDSPLSYAIYMSIIQLALRHEHIREIAFVSLVSFTTTIPENKSDACEIFDALLKPLIPKLSPEWNNIVVNALKK